MKKVMQRFRQVANIGSAADFMFCVVHVAAKQFRAIGEGWTEKDGRLPVNPSGGLKAKGHPIGATGVSMHAIAAMQLTGSAGEMQIKDAKLAGIFNMGGAAVANYVSILEPLR